MFTKLNELILFQKYNVMPVSEEILERNYTCIIKCIIVGINVFTDVPVKNFRRNIKLKFPTRTVRRGNYFQGKT